MSITKDEIVRALTPSLPMEVVIHMLEDYQEIKQQFFLRRFKPSELDAGRFAESVLRLLEFRDIGDYTPYGKQIDSEKIIRRVENNISLMEAERFLIPRQARVLLDIRNKRNVAHPAGDVDPNFSDSVFIVHGADWILTELIRLYYTCSIDEARRIVDSINQVSIPIVADIDGFIRIQDADMDARKKTLVILYHKDPDKVSDIDLAKWLKYKNVSRLRKELLPRLDDECLIHYQNGKCALLPNGKLYLEKNISLELIS